MGEVMRTDRGTGYLLDNPSVVRRVDALYPEALIHPDGTWEARQEKPALSRKVPEPEGREAVIYCTNQDFFPGLRASLRSLLHFHPEVPVIVISWDLSPAQEAYLSGFATVVPRRTDLPDDPTWGRLGLFHTKVRRAIYLDADTIILRPIDELLSLQSPFAAAPNLDWAIRENFSDSGLLHELGVNPELPAFNAGVLVVDVSYWGTRLYDELLDLERRYGGSFLLGDQSALHLAFNRSPYPFTWLPEKFNALAEFWDWDNDPDTPRIVHYAGPDKPWHPAYKYPAQELFLRWSTIPHARVEGRSQPTQ
jgi:hypothetical protein